MREDQRAPLLTALEQARAAAVFPAARYVGRERLAVITLATMPAFRDKHRLVGEVARVLEPGGRFGLTIEQRRPLTEQERARRFARVAEKI